MRVAILDDYQRVARGLADWGRLPAGGELAVLDRHVADREELVRTPEPFEVLVAMRGRTPFPADLLDRLPRLRLLVTTGMRNVSIDLEACRRRGVAVCGTGGARLPTAELAWGLILALAKRITAEDWAVRAGAWQTSGRRSVTAAAVGPEASAPACSSLELWQHPGAGTPRERPRKSV